MLNSRLSSSHLGFSERSTPVSYQRHNNRNALLSVRSSKACRWFTAPLKHVPCNLAKHTAFGAFGLSTCSSTMDWATGQHITGWTLAVLIFYPSHYLSWCQAQQLFVGSCTREGAPLIWKVMFRPYTRALKSSSDLEHLELLPLELYVWCQIKTRRHRKVSSAKVSHTFCQRNLIQIWFFPQAIRAMLIW
jgi:hypothetical protein